MNKRLFGILGVVALLTMSGCALVTGIDDAECWPYGRIIAGDLSSDCKWPEGGDGGEGAGGAGDAGDAGEGDSGEGEGEGDSGEGEGEGEGEGGESEGGEQGPY